MEVVLLSKNVAVAAETENGARMAARRRFQSLKKNGAVAEHTRTLGYF